MIEIGQYRYVIYFVSVILGVLGGAFIAVANHQYKNEKSIFDKSWLNHWQKFIPYYVFWSMVTIVFNLLLVRTTISDVTMQNTNLYMTYAEFILMVFKILLFPLLAIAFTTDIRFRIIPNRVTMMLFQLGILFVIVETIFASSITLNYIYLSHALAGVVTVIAIFGSMIVLGRIFYGKEAMGMGDIKFMAPIGLFFGFIKVLDITLLAFLSSAIFAVIVMIYRKARKIKDDYMPFGPFLVFATIVCMFTKPWAIVSIFFLMIQSITDTIILVVRNGF